jgi:hypothetical protein
LVRLIVALSFLIVSVGLIVIAFGLGTTSSTGTVLVNLGTEIFGILVTIAVVEWFFDRKRRQDRARELAWGLLHGIERVVWTWQGGPQQVGPEELLGIISGIRSKDPIARPTKTLMVNLGGKARAALDKEPQVVRSLSGLQNALEDVQSLRSLQDGDSAVSVRMVAEILEASTNDLASVLALSTQRIPAGLIRYRDASEAAQQERFHTTGAGAALPDPEPERRSPNASGEPRLA